MRIVYIIAGSGRMECDMCLRDGLLARTLKAKGHEVVFVPLYTPLAAVIGDRQGQRLFYGGINIFLQQKFPLFRRTPRLLHKLFNHPRLLDFVARFGHLTQASDLAELTISVMEGEEGNQRKELDEMLGWLETEPRPDAVILPTSLLAGLAGPIRRRLGAPVLCLLSGEDLFIEQFPEPHRTRTREVLRRRAREVSGFMAGGAWYAGFMTEYLGVAPEMVRTMVPGIDVNAYQREAAPKPGTFTIGYRAQVYPANGLHVLAEALKILKSDPETAACQVRAAGHLDPGDRGYLKEIMKKIRRWGLEGSFEYLGPLTPEGRIDFLKGLHVFTVPAVYPEPIGSYVPEALAAGTAVVLPRAGCLPEWVERTGGGMLIERADPESLAQGIGRLMRDRELAQRLGESGRETIFREHTLERMADSILAALKSLTPRPGAEIGRDTAAGVGGQGNLT